MITDPSVLDENGGECKIVGLRHRPAERSARRSSSDASADTPSRCFSPTRRCTPTCSRSRTARSTPARCRATCCPSATASSTAARPTRCARACCRWTRCWSRSPPGASCSSCARTRRNRPFLDALHVGTQEEIRERAAMMAARSTRASACCSRRWRRPASSTTRCIVFLGDNGFFFGEHGLGAERRFAYEEGIRTAFFVRYPQAHRGGQPLPADGASATDIAPTLDRAGGRQARAADAGPLAGAADERPRQALARGVPGRVLRRVGLAVDRRHELQGAAHRALQVHPLDPSRQGRRSTSCTTSSAIRTR